jgi:hypothetical protein
LVFRIDPHATLVEPDDDENYSFRNEFPPFRKGG